MISLTGKTALITGATGGIGGSCAKLFDELGANLILTGRNETKLQELNSNLTRQAELVVCDLTNHEKCAQLIDNLDKIDILICNAGMTKDNLSIRLKDEDFSEVIDVNLTASFILNRSALKKMIRARSGRIINISSVVAFTGNAGQANYTASKAGLIGMTKSLALEVANRGITVNAIAPGFIATNMTDALTDEQKGKIAEKIPMQKQGNPEDIAQAAAFLASDQASYITGQTLHVNGGLYLA